MRPKGEDNLPLLNMRAEARRRLQEADPNLKIVSGRAKRIPGSRVPRVLSPEEAEQWGLPVLLPIFETEEVLAIEALWSKKQLQNIAIEYNLDPRGDKSDLVHLLLYLGILDHEGKRTNKARRSRAVAPAAEVGQFIKVGDKVRAIGKSKYRYDSWPSGVWLQAGLTGHIVDYHSGSPAVKISGEYFEALEEYAVVEWGGHAGVQTAIDPSGEGETWERIQE